MPWHLRYVREQSRVNRKTSTPLARFYSVSSLRRCISRKVHSTDGPADQPTNRFRDIRKSPRGFSFRLFVAFRFPSIHGVTFSPERTRRDYLLFHRKLTGVSSRGKVWETIRDQSGNTTRYYSPLANIVSKWSSTYARNLSPWDVHEIFLVHPAKYGCAITNYICLIRKSLAILYLFNDHVNMLMQKSVFHARGD